MQEKIHEIIFNKDDVSWRSMLFEVIKKENMDPWDINVKVIAEKFLEMLKSFKKMDFKISGKVILASALLLKMKSEKFLKNDISKMDALLKDSDDSYEEIEDEEYNFIPEIETETKEQIKLVPRTPQPRKRKVSIFDLVNALEQALEVKQRRINRLSEFEAPEVKKPKSNFDITKSINDLYNRIQNLFYANKARINFNQLITSDTKEDKVYTFIPLLHLTNQRKIDLHQKEHFGDIEISVVEHSLSKQDS